MSKLLVKFCSWYLNKRGHAVDVSLHRTIIVNGIKFDVASIEMSVEPTLLGNEHQVNIKGIDHVIRRRRLIGS